MKRIFALCFTVFCIQALFAQNKPVAADDEFAFADSIENVAIDILANDTAPQNDSLHIGAIFSVDTNNNLGTIDVDPTTHVVNFRRTEGACGMQYFLYLVCDSQYCDTGKITISFACAEDVFLPKGFSPNGDGKNDLLVFSKLENFSAVSLRIFNRYGTVVYDNSDYQNDWNGTALDSGKPLPDGTYFYILQLPGKHTYNSYLIINR